MVVVLGTGGTVASWCVDTATGFVVFGDEGAAGLLAGELEVGVRVSVAAGGWLGWRGGGRQVGGVVRQWWVWGVVGRL